MNRQLDDMDDDGPDEIHPVMFVFVVALIAAMPFVVLGALEHSLTVRLAASVAAGAFMAVLLWRFQNK